ncbi:MAG: glutamate racemase, partial [Hymenobacter sp.]
LGVDLHALATPLLVPMIEEGFFNGRVSEEIIRAYLDHPTLQGIDALLLACTHFPLIKPQMEAYYQGRVAVLDPSDVVAATVAEALATRQLLAPAAGTTPVHHFYVSDFTRSFEESTRIFFGQEVQLEHYPLWE